ncbi:MAG: sigma 54-interacting transcriptional regulator [Planctomycetota bacterium]
MKPRSCWSLVGSSSTAELIRDFVRVNSRLSGPVLLSGEPGVGKGRIARFIHQGSLFRAHPFQVVDCSAFFEDELGAELFGCSDRDANGCAKPGTLRDPGGGTCYFARCEEIAPSIQARLREYIESCRGRESGESGSRRLVFSSSRDIAAFARAGLFDRKLFDTFAGSLLAVHPLRKRQEDLGPLVGYYSAGSREPAPVFSPAALKALTSYPWPGNHHELENEVSRLLKSVRGEIGVEHLSLRIANFWLGGRQDPDVGKVSRQLDECMEEFKVLTRLDSVFGNLLLTENKWGDEAVNPEARSSGTGY